MPTHRRKDTRSPKKVESDLALITYVEREFSTPWKIQRRPWVYQYLLNNAYYNGHQFVEMSGGSLVLRKRRAREVQIAHNHFKPAARVVLGQVTKNRPIMDLRAMKDGFESEAEMIAARRILKGLQYATRKQHVDQQLWLSLMKGGTAFKRVMWNKRAGTYGEFTARDDDGHELHRDLRRGQNGKVRPDPDVTEIVAKILERRFVGEEIPAGAEQVVYEENFSPEVELRYEGMVDIDVYNVMEGAAEQSFWDLCEADMCLIERWRSNRYIEATWPDLGRAVNPESDVALLFDTAGYSSYLPGASLARTVGPETHSAGRTDGAVVRELWIKPTEQNPLSHKIVAGQMDFESELKPAEKGARFVWANDVVLEGADSPMTYAETPGTDQIDE